MYRSCLIVALLLAVLLPNLLVAQNPGIVKDIVSGSASSFYVSQNGILTRDVLGDIVLFSGTDGQCGQEIFTSVPPYTAASTGLLKDMTPGSDGSSRYYHSAFGKLYFVSPATLGSTAICRSDGTPAGTSVLHAPSVKKGFSSFISQIHPSQGMLFFTRSVSKVGNPTFNPSFEFWKTDPTTGSSVLLRSSSGGTYSTIGSVNGTTVVIEFGTNRLYSSNGTSKGTKSIASLPSGGPTSPYPSNHVYSACRTYHVAGDNLFFTWGDETNGHELWKTDGTAAGTFRVTDLNPGAGSSSPSMGAVMNGYLYFAATDGVNGWQIWRIPAGSGTAERITNLPGGTAGADPMWLTVVDGWLYFSAFTPQTGRELWRCNGLPLGNANALVELVADINPGSANADPNYAEPFRADRDRTYMYALAEMGGWLYFAADDGNGHALWRSDGSTTEKLGAAQPRLLTPVRHLENGIWRDMLLFIAWSEGEGSELWKFDPQQWGVPKGGETAAAEQVALRANHPNPFRSSTVMEFRIAEAGPVTLTVFDMHGRRVRTLVDGWSDAGIHRVRFDAGTLPAGCYIARLDAQGRMQSRLLNLLR